MIRFAASLSVILLSVAAVTPARVWADEPLAFFEKRVRPVLVEHCVRCHGAEEANGSLRLDSRAGWQTGGERGPVIVPGQPAASLLLKAIGYTDDALQMPPPDDGGKLTDRQIADLRTWIEQGAVDPREGRASPARDIQAARRHWAFQPLAGVQIPAGKHPVDWLINQQLAAQELVAAPPADPRILVRRATYDLHGLPPSVEQLAAGSADFAALLDALLASPRYGERWGRHWLDVARYADTKDGVLMYGDKRIRPFAYTYRDYVIRAFHTDKPFDRFIQEQLAADQLDLPPDAPELAALGFLTLGRMFDNNRHDVIDDQIDTVTRGLLGLTVSCARCHDHKFDPIPTADYYSLYGIFASSVEPFERPRIESPSPEGAAFEKELAAKLAAVREMQSQQYAAILQTARERTARYLVRVATTEPDVSETAIFFLSLLPEHLRPQIVNRWRKLIARRAQPGDPLFGPWHDMINEPVLRVAQWQQQGVDPRVIDALATAQPQTAEQIAQAYGELLARVWQSGEAEESDPLVELIAGRDSPVWFPRSEVWHYMSRKDKDKFRGLVNELDLLAVKSPQAAARAMVLCDAPEPYAPVIFRRGDPTQPTQPVPRRFLAILASEPRQPFAQGSGRWELARSITDAENPLTARVLVNRVWLHHFGAPLVENPDDFGLRTPAPEQGQLLDYLAARLIEGGWRLKPLHRLIMTSAAYQRSSAVGEDPQQKQQHSRDPGNRWWWRANRRRLDLESMRDALLLVSGQLDLTMYGRPQAITDPANRRRTVYALVERQSIPSLVRDFDFASPDASVARRNITTVPQQALFAMNSEFVNRAANKLAARADAAEPRARIEQLHRLAFGRAATREEIELGLDFTAAAGWQEYAQVLLMTNEFLFVD